MFTGIVQKLAPVLSARHEGQSTQLRVRTGIADLESGESIAVNGVCLTVTDFDPAGDASFYVSQETLDRTALGGLRDGSLVNLERAVTLATRLSGHLVQGHVDGIGRIASIERHAGSYLTQFDLPAALSRYCVEKGSIALNGVSLTINAISGERISITLIPHTWEHTQFCRASVGDPVHVEVDVLAKYVESLLRRPTA